MNRIRRRCSRVLVRHLAEVGVEQRVALGLRQLVVDGEVREVEEPVAHAGVLPVDDPDPGRRADEVGVQQVVVARLRRPGAERAFDLVGAGLGLLVLGGDPDAVRLRGLAVGLDDSKGVERRGEGRAVVDAPEQSGDLAQAFGPADLLDRDDAAVDEARDQRAFDEVDDLGPDPEPGCDAGRLVLRGPVDTEELGVRARDPKHVRLLVDADDEVVVRDAAAERLDVELPIRPHARRYLLRPHRAILSCPRAGFPARLQRDDLRRRAICCAGSSWSSSRTRNP